MSNLIIRTTATTPFHLLSATEEKNLTIMLYKFHFHYKETSHCQGHVPITIKDIYIPARTSGFYSCALYDDADPSSYNIRSMIAFCDYGAHTIGVGLCNFFSKRLYNFTGKGDADPSLNPPYAAFLKTQCKSLSDNTTSVPMDPGSSLIFDTHYYKNLKLHQGLFQSDAALLTNQRSIHIVDKMLNTENFFNAFKNSIKRMGAIEVLTGTNGQIRKKCSVVNS